MPKHHSSTINAARITQLLDQDSLDNPFSDVSSSESGYFVALLLLMVLLLLLLLLLGITV